MNVKYPYRFKTKEEFENEFGPSWRVGSVRKGIFWSTTMDCLFGTDLNCHINFDEHEETICGKVVSIYDEIRRISLWITPDMLVSKIITPDYSPKKFVREI